MWKLSGKHSNTHIMTGEPNPERKPIPLCDIFQEELAVLVMDTRQVASPLRARVDRFVPRHCFLNDAVNSVFIWNKLWQGGVICFLVVNYNI